MITPDAKDGKPIAIATCTNCGMVQLAAPPDDAALSEFYAEQYRVDYRGSASPKLRNVHKAGQKAARRLEQILPHLAPGARALDIGAGGGEFVFLAQECGLRSAGIDPSGAYVEFARSNYGIDLSRAEVADLDRDRRFDLITMFHVLEHLAHPREVFEQVAALLDDKGLFVIEVPNFGSPQLAPSNTFFKAHINYFTPETLYSLASPLFETVTTSIGKDLLVILRKRDAPVARDTRQDAAALAVARDRFRRRGALEYLRNGGALSVFRKIGQAMATRNAIANKTPRAILEAQATTINPGG